MSDLDKFDYECQGQITITEYLQSQIKKGVVKDLTEWINSQGKAQYTQIKEVVQKAYEDYHGSPEFVDRLTNVISIYVLEQSMGYMDYLKRESGVTP